MLLLYSEIITPRITYIFDFIFNELLGIRYQVTTDKELFKSYPEEKINYSQSRISNEFYTRSTDLLFEKNINNKHVGVIQKDEMTILFPTQNSDVDFDIFAATFYMISRYEEYLPFTPDKFGRFRSSESLAYKYKFLQKPVVNIWIYKFKSLLKEKYPSIQFKEQQFNVVFTYDIDVAYKYKGRSFFRNLRSSFKDVLLLNFKNIATRTKVLRGVKADEWDVYDHLKEIILKNNLNAIFFFLMGDYAEYDKNLNHKSAAMKNVVTNISSLCKIGIHPSYRSNKCREKVIIEKKRLENSSNKKINKSRQHYLKLTLPETYNNLIKAGITEDHSMGFADMPGFRAGTCTPFYFYDLKNERTTSIKAFPVTCMDSSFIKYLKVDTDKSFQLITDLIEEIKKVNGTFISIWHNNYLADKNWKDLHDKIIASAVALK